MYVDDSDSEPEADSGGILSADISVTNIQQESTYEDGASRECEIDQATSLKVTPVDQTTKHCVVTNNDNSMAIVEDAMVCSYAASVHNSMIIIKQWQ